MTYSMPNSIGLDYDHHRHILKHLNGHGRVVNAPDPQTLNASYTTLIPRITIVLRKPFVYCHYPSLEHIKSCSSVCEKACTGSFATESYVGGRM